MADKVDAVCVLVHNPYAWPEQFLAVTRPRDNGALGLPAGKVDPGESPMEAVIRECQEETGLTPWNIRSLVVLPVGDMNCECFVAGFFTGELQQREEGVIPQWVEAERLLSGPFKDYQEKVLHLRARSEWDWAPEDSFTGACECCQHAWRDHSCVPFHYRLGLYGKGRCWFPGCDCWGEKRRAEALEERRKEEQQLIASQQAFQARVDKAIAEKRLRRGRKQRLECFRCHRAANISIPSRAYSPSCSVCGTVLLP